MSRRIVGIGVFVVAIFMCAYLLVGIGMVLAGQQTDDHSVPAFTDAFLAEEARQSGNRALAMREVNDARNLSVASGRTALQGANRAAMMPNVIPLFLEDRQFTSTLVLVNASAVTTYADVGFTARNGAHITTQRVQFAPHSQQTIDIGAVLASAASTASSGSISIMVSPDVQPSSIAAQLSMTYSGGPNPNYIDEELEMPSMNISSTLRGVAERSKGSPIIGITSLADSSQVVTIQCLEDNGLAASKSVSLLTGETLFTQACNAKTPYGADLETAMLGNDSAMRNSVGISLTSTAKAGEFVAFGLAPKGDSEHRYFSGIAFSDPATLMSPNTTFTGVPMGRSLLLPDGNYVPELSLANFSEKAIHVRVKYAATSGTSASIFDEGSLVVPGRTTRWIPLAEVRPLDSFQNSFIVESDGAPGDLIAKMVSASNSQLHEIELPAKDEQDMNNSGAHPWSLQGGNESTLLLFNHGDNANYVNVVISAGSATWEKAFKLAPMQNMALSIRSVIQSGMKGDKGETLPADTAVGMVEWFPGHSGGVAGRMLVSNRALEMARSFSCNYYEYLCQAEFQGGTTLIIDGQVVNFGSIIPGVCLGYSPCDPGGTLEYQGGSGFTYYWSSANTGIISVSGSNTNSSVNTLGVAPGSTTVTGDASDGTCDAQGGGGGYVGPYQVEPIQTESEFSVACVLPGGEGSGWERNVDNQVQYSDGTPYAVSVTGSDYITVGTPNDLNLSNPQTGSDSSPNGVFPDEYYDCSRVCPSTGQTDALQYFTINGVSLPHADSLVYKCNSITIDGH